MNRSTEGRRRLGIVVGGGPAPGINGVIAAATSDALRQGWEVLGFDDGFKWLASGDCSHVRPLTTEEVEKVRGRGGSILHTSRENPTKDDAKMQNVVDGLRKLGIDCLVTIGGDDTAFSAYQTSVRSQGAVRVAHVPKSTTLGSKTVHVFVSSRFRKTSTRISFWFNLFHQADPFLGVPSIDHIAGPLAE